MDYNPEEQNQDNLKPEKISEEKNSESEKKGDAERAEILENLPPEIKRTMEMAISMQTGRMPNPILSKLTEDHITKILDQSEKEDENSFKDTQSSKAYNLIYFVITVLLIVFFVIYLADRDKALLLNLADKALYILAGFGGGYGFKAFRDSKKNK